jgi:hypothetical protein
MKLLNAPTIPRHKLTHLNMLTSVLIRSNCLNDTPQPDMRFNPTKVVPSPYQGEGRGEGEACIIHSYGVTYGHK